MLRLAVQAQLPLIAVTTRDTLNLPEVIEEITGKKPVELKPELAGNTLKPGTLYMLVASGAKLGQSLPKLYETMTKAECSLLIVNAAHPDDAVFDAGEVPVPKSLVMKFMMAVTKNEKKRHDALTGLGNRFLLQERLEQAVASLDRGDSFAVLVIDLDHFKSANDSLGHTVGDALLRELAVRLRSCVLGSDTIVRTGGDEFAIVQTAITGPEEAGDLATAILAALAKPFIIDDHQIDIGASIGIACAPRDEVVGTLLLRLADIALYRAKAEGRRAYRFFEASMDFEVQARRQLAKDLRVALLREEFELYFQPINSAKTNLIKSFEALVRWRHPVRGMVSPDEFIRLAEETDLIVPLGEWVLKAACREASRWPSEIGVAVNISASQFSAGDLVGTIREALDLAKLPANRLEVEITESIFLAGTNDNLTILHELRAMGIKIAMDDFGTGYSSLSYLRSFPFDKIKIDQSFVKNIDERDAREIVRAIANLGQTLGIATTAEGVETRQQLQATIAYGCTEVQGYFFSRPVPVSGVCRLIEEFQQQRQVA